jgi:hypothetical protein
LHLRRGDFGKGRFFVAPTDWYRQWLAENWAGWNRPVLYIASDAPDKVVCDFAEYHPVTATELGVEMPGYPDYPDYQCPVDIFGKDTSANPPREA